MNILNDIINRSGFLVFIWRIEPGKWPVEFVSENVADIIRYTADDFISGRVSWPKITHPDDVPRLEKEVAQYLEKGERKWSQEYRVITKAGETRWFHADNFALEASGGETNRIQATIHDITEHKRVEKALRERVKELHCLHAITDLIEKEDSLEKIFQGIADLIPVALQDPEVTGARIILGKQEFKTNNFQETPWKQSEDIIVYGQPAGMVEVCYLNERSTGDAEPFLKEARQLLHTIAERLEKITGRKQAGDELLKLKTAVEQAADGMVMTDLQGRIIFANTAWADMHGYTVNELIGKDINILHTAEQLRGEVVPFNAIVMKNGSNEGEVGHCRRDGTTFPTWTTNALVKDNYGKPTVVVGMARDITGCKRANA